MSNTFFHGGRKVL